jgi:hypothetical protein
MALFFGLLVTLEAKCWPIYVSGFLLFFFSRALLQDES